MRVADLSQAVIKQIRLCRYDRIIEKHEGPEDWDAIFQYDYQPEFLTIQGYNVLLPIEGEHHAKLTVLRCIPGKDEQSLTIFLKNAWYAEAYNVDPEDDTLYSGFVAICDKFPDHDFYLATFYHEWFIIDPVQKQLTLAANCD